MFYGFVLWKPSPFARMYVCYIDESGDTSCLKDDKAQPAFIIVGLIVEQSLIHRVTQDFLSLKQSFNPNALPPNARRLDWIREEIKGTDLRREVCDNGRRKRRHAIGFLDKVMDLIERHNVRVVGRVFIKELNQPVNHVSIYSHTVQYICEHFEHFLQCRRTSGIVVVDSRTPTQNVEAAHSIFTQKFKASGDSYPSLMEAPAFGHSDNHAGIQLADLLCSAFLWPMAMHGYCEGKLTSIHVRNGYWQVGQRYGERIRRIQHRYQFGSGQWHGGISVSDRLGKQSGSHLFRATPPPASVSPPAPIPALPSPPPTTPPQRHNVTGICFAKA